MVLKEYAKDFFDMPVDSSPYMQFTAKCKFPNEFPAIVHVDGTSRVQTVDESAPLARKLLEAWYTETGCPMLLNTSLNIKGQPIVNDIIDSLAFQEKYNMKVFN
jgi:carbamoyltransferase